MAVIAAASNRAIRLKDTAFAHLVRYEELVSRDRRKMAASLASLSQATGCGEDEAFAAVEKTLDKPNWTFFKQHSDYRKMWNPEIEDLFQKSGLGEVNEQLG